MVPIWSSEGNKCEFSRAKHIPVPPSHCHGAKIQVSSYWLHPLALAWSPWITHWLKKFLVLQWWRDSWSYLHINISSNHIFLSSCWLLKATLKLHWRYSSLAQRNFSLLNNGNEGKNASLKLWLVSEGGRIKMPSGIWVFYDCHNRSCWRCRCLFPVWARSLLHPHCCTLGNLSVLYI